MKRHPFSACTSVAGEPSRTITSALLLACSFALALVARGAYITRESSTSLAAKGGYPMHEARSSGARDWLASSRA